MNVPQNLSNKPVLPVTFQVLLFSLKILASAVRQRVSVVVSSTVNLERATAWDCRGGVSIPAALARVGSLLPGSGVTPSS